MFSLDLGHLDRIAGGLPCQVLVRNRTEETEKLLNCVDLMIVQFGNERIGFSDTQKLLSKVIAKNKP